MSAGALTQGTLTLKERRLAALLEGAKDALRGDKAELPYDLALWLFVSLGKSDLLIHSCLLHPNGAVAENPLVKKAQIPYGQGTIAFVVKNLEPEAVADTFDDPRGTVGVQDVQIQNFSWCGVPIRDDGPENPLIGVASFFPVPRGSSVGSTWRETEIKSVRDALSTFVKKNHDEFLVLCKLDLSQRTASLLSDEADGLHQGKFELEVSDLLRRIVDSGAPYDTIPFVAFVQRPHATARSPVKAYVCESSEHLSCNTGWTERSELGRLQWEAVNALSVNSESRHGYLLQEEVNDVALADDTAIGLYFRMHHRGELGALRGTLCDSLNICFRLFPIVARAASARLDAKNRKLDLEFAAEMFSRISKRLLQYRGAPDAIEPLDFRGNALDRLLDLFVDRFDPPGTSEGSHEWKGLSVRVPGRAHLTGLRSALLGLSLWVKAEDFVVGGYEGFTDDQVEMLQQASNWRVLQRVAQEGSSEIIERYRLPDWPGVRAHDLELSTSNPGSVIFIRWGKHKISFVKRECRVPIALCLAEEGFKSTFFYPAETEALTLFPNEDFEKTGVMEAAKSSCYKLQGQYRSLLHFDESVTRTVVIGPYRTPDLAMKPQGGRALSTFVQQQLRSILVTDYSRRVTEASQRAAIAAIMARNMSHNLGSHVLARHSLRALPELTLKPCTDFVGGATIESCCEELRASLNLSRSLRVDIQDIRLLERYLQARMDYIAQVSSEWPLWTEGAHLVGELLWGFLSQRILLEEIAASEGVGAVYWELVNGKMQGRDQLSGGGIRFICLGVSEQAWKVFPKMRPSLEERTRGSHSFLTIRPLQTDHRLWSTEVSFTDDPLIAIPGGASGWHAFYVVLENILRNAAKHATWRKDERAVWQRPLDLVIEVSTGFREVVPADEEQMKSSQSRPATLLRIYDNVSLVTPEKIDEINDALCASFIDHDGGLRRENWGLAEMKIALAFLQGRSPNCLAGEDLRGAATSSQLLKNSSGTCPLVRAVESPIGSLGYEFPVLTPRKVGLISA